MTDNVQETPKVAGVSDPTFLDFEGASKSFDGLKVFENLTFCLKPGVVYGLVGPNACGKTTLVHSAMGLTRLDEGTIRYRGTDITELKPHSIARLGLGILLQNVGIFHRISAMENVLTGLEAYNRWLTKDGKDMEDMTLRWSSEERAKWSLAQVGLDGYESQLAGSLVPGEQKRLAIARILFASRDFLLDEPVSGIDSETKTSLRELIRKLVKEGRSMLIIEHDIDFILQTCDEVMLLKNGSIACQGPPDTVMRDDEFQEFYSSLKIDRSTGG